MSFAHTIATLVIINEIYVLQSIVFHNAATVSEHTQFMGYVQVQKVWDSDTIQPDVININTLTKLLTSLRNEWAKTKHVKILRPRAPYTTQQQWQPWAQYTKSVL